jgi:glycosyltransferase involved in cell wall biosynthesis
MKDKDLKLFQRKVDLVTLRNPVPARYSKILKSLGSKFCANLITGTLFPTLHLRMNVGTVLSYGNLFAKLSFHQTPVMIDVNALICAKLRSKKNLVVDFRTPFSYELNYLGHGLLSKVAKNNEFSLKHIGLVTAANELMAQYCAKHGAKNVVIIPNYPKEIFRTQLNEQKHKIQLGVPPEEKIVLFTGGVRVKEIYGSDLLLESWSIVEKTQDHCTLVVLGDDSVEYMKTKVRKLKLRKVHFPGIVSGIGVASWIERANVCVAPRTPDFSNEYYNDKDSTKISEYAAFKKPIVATRYAPSSQYMLVDPNPAAFSEGILKGLAGNITPSKPHFWEENEPLLLNSLQSFWSKL